MAEVIANLKMLDSCRPDATADGVRYRHFPVSSVLYDASG